MADLVRIQTGKDFTDPLCALIALLKPGLVFTSEQLKSLPVTQQEALLFESVPEGSPGVDTDKMNPSGHPLIQVFFQNIASTERMLNRSQKPIPLSEGKRKCE